MRRRTLTLISLGLSILFLVYGGFKVADIRDEVLREYLLQREFLYLMERVEKKRPASEVSVRDVLKELGFEPEGISTTDLGVEVILKDVSWRRLPHLVKEVERNFSLVSFEAVDNTGKGLFRVRMVLR